ncbi:butyrophilin subfamily 3 member A2-like isoform X1 [Chaetodon auriga]|uniref:butyrophilin subfamily 3 member A2-like isoform X1 n=1 Tax=Chaetodon auriga TaxID=39042 RepID=UPI00403310C6
MVHMKDGLVRATSVWVSFLLLTHFCEGQLQQIDPPQQVIVMVGEDIVLPCQLEPPVDAVSMTMEWGRADLDPRFVYVWHDGQELLDEQNEAYKGRASLSINKLKHGDLSLTISEVNFSDNGTYRCYIPKWQKEYFVELLVGAVASPGISFAGIHQDSSGVLLDCASEGWHPQPEVSWLDAEGNVLPAGPTGTVRGPDGLYAVSSRVTVEKRHNNTFTCRVQQKNINQTRETRVHVPDDFFMTPSACTASIAMTVLFGFMLIIAVVLLVRTWRQNKIERKMRHKNQNEEKERRRQELLMTESRKIEDLEKKKAKLHEELQKKKDMTQVMEMLKEVMAGLTEHKKKLTFQTQEAERQIEENEKKVKSVEEEVSGKQGDETANRAQGYLKIKEIQRDHKWKQEERIKELQDLQMNTQNLRNRICDEFKKIEERKKKAEIHIEQMKKQMQETEGQTEDIQRAGSKQNNKTNQVLQQLI